MASAKISEILESYKCGDFINTLTSKPVTIESSMDVHQAAEVLAASAITAAPVIDSNTGKMISVFDYEDLVALVLAAFEVGAPKEIDLDSNHLTLAKFLRESHLSHLGNAPVKSVAELGHSKSPVVVGKSEPLSAATKHLKNGVRRCVIVDDDGNFVGMLSQSDIVRFLHKFSDVWKSEGKQSIDSLGIGRKEVATIKENCSVLDAIHQMHKNSISGVAMVNSSGKISGSISMKDLKYAFAMQWFQVLQQSCKNYISSARRVQTLKEKAGMDTTPIISVKPSSQLLMVVDLLIATKTHRVWVLDQDRPVGVVALSDIIRTLCPV